MAAATAVPAPDTAARGAARPSGYHPNNGSAGGAAGSVGVRPHQYREGSLAKAIEGQTAKLPSDAFLWASGASMAASLAAKAMGKQHTALFVGQWAAPFLILGLYNKLVKLEGSE